MKSETRKTLRSSCLSKIFRVTFLIGLLILGAILMWFQFLPRYLEKEMQVSWTVEGSQALRVTGHTIQVLPSFGPLSYNLPYSMIIDAEVENTGGKLLELIAIKSAVTNCEGETALNNNSNVSLTKSVYSVYYDDFSSNLFEMGVLIPPGQKRPLTASASSLFRETLFAQMTSTKSRASIIMSPLYYWEVFGLPVFKWCRADITFVVREAQPKVADWYQYWDDVPIVDTWEVRSYNPLAILLQQDKHFYTKIDFDAVPIFDQLVGRYGNKGIPDPNGITGRIITLPNGSQVVSGDFDPELRYIITYYDKDGNFLGYQTSVSFTKDDYERWLGRNDGYLVIDKFSLELPHGVKIHSAKAYLELTPDD